MKTKEITNENMVLTELRLIRDKISNEIIGMTPEQVVAYLKNKNTLHKISF